MLIINTYKKQRKCAIKKRNSDYWVGPANYYSFLPCSFEEKKRLVFDSYNEAIKYINNNLAAFTRTKGVTIELEFDKKHNGFSMTDYDFIIDYDIILLD
jgi:hypothetical protein